MPKLIGQYILEIRIGSGMFADVYKGYHKTTNQDVAIKVIKKSELQKQKQLQQLLDNEILVLQKCDCQSIIKLFDVYYTQKHIYMILEYCNGGDLQEYLKKKKFLKEEEAVDILKQILNAFKMLHKYDIMHRDFKLANVLMHEGIIKVADFGFSKFIQNDLTSTVLGSPLNMAPEILSASDYTNKADIWSIGTVFYELLFGKPPFIGIDMVDLRQNIKKEKLKFPLYINNISPQSEDLLKKMLTVDYKLRIEWEDLFCHEVNYFLEEKLKNEILAAVGRKDANISISNYYKVKKQCDQNNQNQTICDSFELEQSKLEHQDQLKINKIKKKNNANRILHERNIYVFLASLAETISQKQSLKYSQVAFFLITKKLLSLIKQLLQNLEAKNNIFNLEIWDEFLESNDFNETIQLIQREHTIFQTYFDACYQQVKDTDISDEYKEFVNTNLEQQIPKKTLKKALVLYDIEFVKYLDLQSQSEKQDYIIAKRLIDCNYLDELFMYEDEEGITFDFKEYYESYNEFEKIILQKQVKKQLNKLQKNL